MKSLRVLFFYVINVYNVLRTEVKMCYFRTFVSFFVTVLELMPKKNSTFRAIYAQLEPLGRLESFWALFTTSLSFFRVLFKAQV